MTLANSSYDPGELCSHVVSVVEARARLDGSISGYNRHARLAAQYRQSMERFERARDNFQSVRAALEETREAAASTRRSAELERLRSARQSAEYHRAGIERHVRAYVHSLRGEGISPERVLVAVKHRLIHAVTTLAPEAPRFDALLLAEDVSAWAIAALFDAA